MFVVDTNVLVYAAAETLPEHRRCRRLLTGWRAQAAAWFTTWGILYEFVRIVTHPRVFERPWTVDRAWNFVEALLAAPGLQLLVETDRHSPVARQVLAEVPMLQGNLIHDVHTAVLMREHGIRQIYSRDTDFHRFPFLEVIDPMRD